MSNSGYNIMLHILSKMYKTVPFILTVVAYAQAQSGYLQVI